MQNNIVKNKPRTTGLPCTTQFVVRDLCLRHSVVRGKHLKIIALIIICAFFVFLFYQYFALNKSVIYTNNFQNESVMVSNLYPDGRAKNPEMNLKTGEKYQRVVNEPVYFDVFLPNLFGKQIFEKVKIDLMYQNKNQNIIELGLRKDYKNESNWAFELQPIQNKFIDEFDGVKIINDNLTLLQRQNNFKSIDEFIKIPPLDKKIMTYNYKLDYDFQIKNYTPSTKSYKFNYPLVGSHAFLFYKGAEAANFTLDAQKIAENQDLFNIQITNQNGEVLFNKLWNDGTGNENNKQFTIQLKDVGAGLYYLKINASDNYLFKTIETSQKYFVIQNRINLAKTDRAVKLYTIAPETYTIAKNAAGFQTITINDDKVAVYDMEEKSVWPKKEIAKIDNGLQTINIPRGEIILSNDSYFSFNRENYFSPQMVAPIKYYNSNNDFDYLIANNYQSPYHSKRFYNSSTTFDLTNMNGKTNSLNFILSLPGIAKNDDDVSIYKIKAELIRKSFSFSKLKNLFRK